LPTPLTVKAELTAADDRRQIYTARACATFLTAERLGPDSQVRSRLIAAASWRRWTGVVEEDNEQDWSGPRDLVAR
jgi:hypothetical protein